MELPKGKVNSNINVTPLVDVMLVLLIIFMVVTPMLQKGAAVTLPITDEPTKQEEGKDQILLAVQWGGDPNQPKVIDIARHAEAMAHILIALALQDGRVH